MHKFPVQLKKAGNSRGVEVRWLKDWRFQLSESGSSVHRPRVHSLSLRRVGVNCVNVLDLRFGIHYSLRHQGSTGRGMIRQFRALSFQRRRHASSRRYRGTANIQINDVRQESEPEPPEPTQPEPSCARPRLTCRRLPKPNPSTALELGHVGPRPGTSC